MPKIEAPTVAEHRVARVRALIDAARELLTANPERLPTLAEVGNRAGLSRSSVYQYFSSREDLLAAAVVDVFPRWSERIDTTLAAATTPGDQILAYARVNLEMVAEGEHTLARALVSFAPRDVLATQDTDIHARLLTPLQDALLELGAEDPGATAQLINAVVFAGARMIENGATADEVYQRVTELLAPYAVG